MSAANTLRRYREGPASTARPLTGLKYGDIVPVLTNMDKLTKRPSPEVVGSCFYYLNQILRRIEADIGLDTDLGDYTPMVDRYYREIHAQTKRMFLYLIFITFRECRHGNNKPDVTSAPINSLQAYAIKEAASASSETTVALGGLHPSTPVLETLELIKMYYTQQNAFSNNYGGEPWAMVTNTLIQFVAGEISAEIFYDACFSLEHNTGTIFNKPALYLSAGKNDLKKLLNMQADGDIVEQIGEQKNWWKGYVDFDQEVLAKLTTAVKPIQPEAEAEAQETEEVIQEANSVNVMDPTPWGQMSPVRVELIPTITVTLV